MGNSLNKVCSVVSAHYNFTSYELYSYTKKNIVYLYEKLDEDIIFVLGPTNVNIINGLHDKGVIKDTDVRNFYDEHPSSLKISIENEIERIMGIV